MKKIFATAALGLCISGGASAATTGFNQTAAGPWDYNTTGNWASGTINGLWDSSLTLAAAQTVTFSADSALGTGLTFNNAGNFALTLRADGVANHTITLGGDVSVATTGGTTANVTIGNATANQNLNIDLGGTGRTFSVNTSRTLSVLNVVSNGSISKTGAGTLTLSGTNTLAGGITLSAGTLSLGNNAALGTGTLTITGGTLDVTASRTTTNNNAQNWNGDFIYGGSNGLNTGTGAVTMNASRVVTVNGSTITIGGAIGESGAGSSLTKAGAGSMTLNAANTYSGGTNVTAGTLSVGASGNLGSNVSGNNVVVNGAILNLAVNTNLGSNQTLTVGSTSTTLGGLGVAFNSLPTYTQSGSDPILIAINTTGFTALTTEAGAGGNIFLGSTGTGTYANATLGAGSDGTYRLGGGGGTLTITNGVLSGANNLIMGSTLTNGGGTVVLQGTNSLSGTTTVNAGTLRLSGANGTLASSAATVNVGAALNFDSSTSGVAGNTRIGSVTLKSGSLTLNGNNGVNSVDTISGALTVDAVGFGVNYVTLASGTKNAQLAIDNLARTNRGVVIFRGTNLGTNSIASGTASSTNIKFTTGPAVVGGGGAAGSTTISIIPYALGGTTTSDAGSTFVTYDATNGIRTLNTATEYATAIGGNAADNVRLTSATVLNTNATVNSLLTGGALSGTGTLTVTSGAIFLTGTSSGFSNAVDFGSAEGVIGYARGNTISGAIAGSAGMTVYGTRNDEGLTFTGGTSTYTGATTVLNHMSVYNGGASSFLPFGSRTGDVYLYGQLDISGSQTINGLNGTGRIDWSHSFASNLTLGDNNANGNFSGLINEGTQGAMSLTKIGSGTQVLSNANIYRGATTINGGTLSVSVLANGGVASGIGTAANTASSLVLNGGTLQYTGAATSTDHLFQVGATTTGATGTIDASGTGAVNFTNIGNITYGTAGTTGTSQTRTLSLTGSNTGNNTIAAVIGNNGVATNGNSAVGVTKSGTGQWILTGANTYTGATVVNGGTLLVNGSLAAGSTVAVNNTGTLGGIGGTVAGIVNVNSGGTLAPGASIGTLNTGTVNAAAGSTLAFELNTSAGTTDLLNITGDFNLAGTNDAILTLSILGTDTILAPSTVLTLVDYSGTWNGGLFNYLGSALADDSTFTYGLNSFMVNYNDGTALTLTATAVPEPSTYALMGLGFGALYLLRRKKKTT